MMYKDWCEEFFAAKTEPMDETLRELTMKSLMAELHMNMENPFKDMPLFQMVEKHAKAMELQATVPAMIVITCLAMKPGSILMYLSAIRSKTDVLNMEYICKTWPTGYIPEDELQRLWELQKVGSENGLNIWGVDDDAQAADEL